MQKILLTVVLVISWVGFVKAQEMTGPKAEAIKKEILKLEQSKMTSLTSGPDKAAEWSRRVDADGLAFTGPDGHLVTEAQHLAEFKSGVRKDLSIKDDDFHVHVYENGNTAVLTYHGVVTTELKGQTSSFQNRSTDVYIRDGGSWRRVVHHVTKLSTQ